MMKKVYVKAARQSAGELTKHIYISGEQNAPFTVAQARAAVEGLYGRLIQCSVDDNLTAYTVNADGEIRSTRSD